MNNFSLDELDNDFGVLALIDPDLKNDNLLDNLISSINDNDFSAVLVGGSSISDNKYENRLKKIKTNINKPVILFPGSSNQISKFADAILFTSLLSGRNPKYLINEQLKGIKFIKKYNLPVISTGYLLIGGNSPTSVEIQSQTEPLNPEDYENILNHVLVAEYFGMSFIYLENGSGAENCVDCKLIEYLNSRVKIPMIVGGGVTAKNSILDLKKAGARFVVLGTILEKNPNSEFISNLLP
tara:strand:+ start:13963 stop:14682 length:720 start_codon:yes stop_codon:yes gene_type:complete